MKRLSALLLNVALLAAATVTSAQTPRPHFAYTANLGSNNISGYTIDPTTGALTPVPGSPFSAGSGPQSVVVDPTGRFGYVPNRFGQSISAYTIDVSTGSLTAIPGSPFATLTGPLSMTMHPTGKFAYVTLDFGFMAGYAINPTTGALTPVPGSPLSVGTVVPVAFDPSGKFAYIQAFVSGSSGPTVVLGFAIDAATGALSPVPGSPFSTAGSSNGLFRITIDPTGKFAYVPNGASGDVSGFAIDASTGTLTQVPGSPFTAPLAIAVVVDPMSRFAYAVDNSCAFIGDGLVIGFTINSLNGVLAQISGSPFPAGNCPQSMAIHPTGKFAYVVNPGAIVGYVVDAATGALTAVPGSPFQGGSQLISLTMDPSGGFVYVADRGSNDVLAYAINATTGVLTPVTGSPFLAGTNPQSVTITAGLTPVNSMDDDFNGNSLDPNRWSVLAPPPTSTVTVTNTNQQLEVTMGPGAGGGGIFSRCSVSGDFDAQVDYILLNWPSNNSHSVRLGAFDLGVPGVGAVGMNRSSFSSELYILQLLDQFPQTSSADMSGKLRLVRTGSTLSGYFFSGTGWVLVGSGAISTGPTRFNLDLGTNDPNAPGGVSIAFDNFQVNAGTSSCPPPVTHTLTVGSTNPSSGVAITVSPSDNNGQGNGTTQFTRSYNNGVVVTLGAPATAGGNNFSSWTGCDSTSDVTCTVMMNADRTVTANYAVIVGTGTINVTTNLPAATFTIAGPQSFSGGGTSFSQSGVPVGTYSVVYGSVPGYIAPLAEVKTLTTGGSISFRGNYQLAGTITVSTNIPNATFAISPLVPGFPTTGPYPVTYMNAPAGTYTVTFNPLPGYMTPSSTSQTLAAGSSITFRGNYVLAPSGTGSVDLLDAVSLLSGPNNLLDSNTLATQGIRRGGVAADGVAQLIIRYNAPGAGTVSFSLIDQDRNCLFDRDEAGSLTDLNGTQAHCSVQVSTIPSGQVQKAFASYTAPSRFVRTGFPDADAFQREVFIEARFVPVTGGVWLTGQPVPINIFRPLVFLVHGIWSSPSAWDNFEPPVGSLRFFVTRADYQQLNDRTFDTVAPVVYDQLKLDLRSYKRVENVAAIQADVVAHSMGAPVVRTIALSATFLNDTKFPTFGKGPIHKLITIDGVHLGTEMANYLLSNPCVANTLSNIWNLPTGTGAVSDLSHGSPAIQRINAQQTPFPVHTIVSLANTLQKLGTGLIINEWLGFYCPLFVFPGFDSILGPENDFLVDSNSQRGGRSNDSAAVTQFLNVVHSDAFKNIPPLQRELNVSAVANRVVDLLHATDIQLFDPLP